MANILICDDEQDIINALRIYLENHDYVIYEANSGKEALEIVSTKDIDLVLMDIMMPVMDGITAMLSIRKTSNVPVILLTAKSEDSDIILGLDVGADDYITKPFNPLEVASRVKANLRRYLKLGGGVTEKDAIICGGIEIIDSGRMVTVDGEQVNLTPKEYEILRLLASNPGKVYPPDEIYTKVWKEKPFASDNTVAVHIRHLREKIEIDPANPRYIKVLFGQGYKCESFR